MHLDTTWYILIKLENLTQLTLRSYAQILCLLDKDVPEKEFPHESKGGEAGNIIDQFL